MPAHRTLAELTLLWCVDESGTNEIEGGSRLSPDVRADLRDAGRNASKAAVVAMLQAAAAEFGAENCFDLGRIATAIDSEAAMAQLEEQIASDSESLRLASADQRAAFVGRHFATWLESHVGPPALSKGLRVWLQSGWPDTRMRGGVVSFYQAFCGAIQRAIRQNQDTWGVRLVNSGVDAATWRQWLIHEAESSSRAQSNPRNPTRTLAIVCLLIALIAAAAWQWWPEIERFLMSKEPVATTTAITEPPGSSAKPIAFRGTVPNPTPLPDLPTAPAVDTSSPPDQPAEPRVFLQRQPRSKPLAEAARLMDEAERTLSTNKPEAGDVSARSAQDILSALIPTKNAELAESLSRVAQYWEGRGDLAEAARLFQRAVKACEGTPAENTYPQLQLVSRWAGALRQSGRNTEAERLYRMLLEAYDGLGSGLMPEMAAVAHNLGNVLLASGRPRDARQFFGQALSIMADRQSDPRFDRFKDDYADCLRKLGVSEAQIDADIRQFLSSKTPAGTHSAN
jgi:tetratricopeptide (TPR) repeat protein